LAQALPRLLLGAIASEQSGQPFPRLRFATPHRQESEERAILRAGHGQFSAVLEKREASK
jgi:hypothetical protein